MGNAYYALEEYELALIYFHKAIQHAPNASTYAGLANMYTKLHHYQEAVEAFKKTTELDPETNFDCDGYVEARKH